LQAGLTTLLTETNTIAQVLTGEKKKQIKTIRIKDREDSVLGADYERNYVHPEITAHMTRLQTGIFDTCLNDSMNDSE
jgi:hypothetical protein